MDGPQRRPPRRQVKQGRHEVLVPVAEQAAEVVVGPDGAPDGPLSSVPSACRHLVVVGLHLFEVAKCVSTILDVLK